MTSTTWTIGCTSAEQIVLDTLTFQAPDFYAKLGFERVAAVDDHPRGFQRISMRKRLRD